MRERHKCTRNSSLMFATVATCLLAATIASAQATEALEAKSKKAGGKLTVALIPIDAKNMGATPMIAAAFEDAMLKAGRFTVLSRAELDTVMREQRFGTSGMVDPAAAVRLGKALSANYVMVVRQLTFDAKQSLNGAAAWTGIGKKKTTYTMNLQAQVLDTENTQLVQSESFAKTFEMSVTVVGDQAMAEAPAIAGPYRAALDEFAVAFTTKLAAALPLEALVVLARDAKNIALNVGSDSGIRPGTEFVLSEEGQPIKDPSGAILGYDSRKVGRVRVVRVEAKLTWTELLKTYQADGAEDPMPDMSKVKQYLLAKMADGR